MSKLVKKLVSRDIASRLDGVNDAIVANIVGMSGEQNYNIRKAFRDTGVKIMVVKRTLAARATEGSLLRPAFAEQPGSMAVIWGCEDFVSLVRLVTKMVDSGKFPKLEIKGGVMDGDVITADQVKKVASGQVDPNRSPCWLVKFSRLVQTCRVNWSVQLARLLVKSRR